MENGLDVGVTPALGARRDCPPSRIGITDPSLGIVFAGVVLAWIIDPRKVTADIYTAPDAKTTIDAAGVLDGGDVLPGFRVPLAKLVEQLADPTPRRSRGRRSEATEPAMNLKAV